MLHVPPGRGGTLDDPDCPAAVRSGQWGSGAQDTQRSTAIATTTCLPRKVHIIVRISSRTQRGSPRSLPNSKNIASEVLERLEPVAAGTRPHLGASRSGPGVGGSPSSSTAALAAPALPRAPRRPPGAASGGAASSSSTWEKPALSGTKEAMMKTPVAVARHIPQNACGGAPGDAYA